MVMGDQKKSSAAFDVFKDQVGRTMAAMLYAGCIGNPGANMRKSIEFSTLFGVLWRPHGILPHLNTPRLKDEYIIATAIITRKTRVIQDLGVSKVLNCVRISITKP